MSPDHVSILIIIIFVIFLISIVKYHEHYQGYQLLQNPFQAEGWENLKRNSHLDCKCIRNSKGEIDGQNQCTYNVNCIETVGKLPGLEESYALFNPPIQFSNWIKEKTNCSIIAHEIAHVENKTEARANKERKTKLLTYQYNLDAWSNGFSLNPIDPEFITEERDVRRDYPGRPPKNIIFLH